MHHLLTQMYFVERQIYNIIGWKEWYKHDYIHVCNSIEVNMLKVKNRTFPLTVHNKECIFYDK